MKSKIPFLTYLFFILVYANQGFSGLPGQSLYYLTREGWKLSATMLGILAFMTSIAWYIKPLFGIITDCFPLKGFRAKYYLYINYILLIVAGLYIVYFGFNFISLIVILTLMNIAIAFNDVANDTIMVKLEQKYDLKGKIQAVQWMSLGVAGLVVSLGGAYIADKFIAPINYKLAYGLYLLLPLATLIYLKQGYKEEPVRERKNINQLITNFKHLKNKSFLIGILFIFFLRFSPSFGTPLMIQMREHMQIDKMFMGWLGATGTVLGLLGYALYYWKAHKYAMKKLLYFTIVFSTLANLCYLYIPTKWHILGYSLAFGAVDGVCFLAILAFMAKIIPIGAEGFLYAFITSINNFSGHLSGITGGWIYDHVGYSWTVIIASVTTLFCLGFVPFLKFEVNNE